MNQTSPFDPANQSKVEQRPNKEHDKIRLDPFHDARTGAFPRKTYLNALGVLARGHSIIVVSDTSFGIMLEGFPLACCVYKSFIRMGWVERHRVASFLGFCDHYVISTRGMEFYQNGRRWWKGLSFFEKARIMLFE